MVRMVLIRMHTSVIAGMKTQMYDTYSFSQTHLVCHNAPVTRPLLVIVDMTLHNVLVLSYP